MIHCEKWMEEVSSCAFIRGWYGSLEGVLWRSELMCFGREKFTLYMCDSLIHALFTLCMYDWLKHAFTYLVHVRFTDTCLIYLVHVRFTKTYRDMQKWQPSWHSLTWDIMQTAPWKGHLKAALWEQTCDCCSLKASISKEAFESSSLRLDIWLLLFESKHLKRGIWKHFFASRHS